MTKTRQLRALLTYLSLGIPLAASCAREANTLEGDDATSSGGGTKSKGGTTSTAGTTGTTKGGTGSAFGGTSSTAGAAGTKAGGGSSGAGGNGGTAGAGGVAGASGSAGAGGTAAIPPDVLARASAVVYYQTSHATAMDKTIQMKLFITNQSADPLPMAHVKIRYWFTAEVTTELHQYYTGPQVKMPQAMFVSDGANSHVLLTFGGGSIVKGGDMNASEIQLEIDNNTSPFNQADDFSWAPADVAATPNDKITLYLDDTLIWGCEPSGKCFDDGAGGQGAGGQGAAGQSAAGQSAGGQGAGGAP